MDEQQSRKVWLEVEILIHLKYSLLPQVLSCIPVLASWFITNTNPAAAPIGIDSHQYPKTSSNQSIHTVPVKKRAPRTVKKAIERTTMGCRDCSIVTSRYQAPTMPPPSNAASVPKERIYRRVEDLSLRTGRGNLGSATAATAVESFELSVLPCFSERGCSSVRWGFSSMFVSGMGWVVDGSGVTMTELDRVEDKTAEGIVGRLETQW